MKKIAAFLAFLAVSCSPLEEKESGVRLYALDCGRIEIDLINFAQGDEYAGRKKAVVATGFSSVTRKGI